MCGIFCSISKDSNYCEPDLCEKARKALARRGPDSFKCKSLYTVNFDNEIDTRLHLISSVLHMRGVSVVAQPIHDEQERHFFQWNGEMYRSEIETLSTRWSNPSSNDGQVLFDWLRSSSVDPLYGSSMEQRLLQMMSRSHGEYAFTLIDLVDRCVWFARDYFGRRSLCWNVSRSIPEIVENLVWKVGHRSECFDKCGWISMGIMQEFQLCSVVAVDGAKTATWSEVPAYGLFRLSFHDPKELSLDFIPWRKHSSSKTSHDDAVMLYKPFPIEFHLKNFDLKDQMLYSCKEDVRCELYRQLAKAIDRRVHNEESIGILYSGGLDSTVLAFLADECLPQSASIYLLNVSFEAASPDRLNAIESLRDLQRVRPQRDWRFVPVDCDRDQLSRTRVERIGPLIAPKNTVLDDSIGCALWFAASGVRCRPDFEPQPFRVLLVGSGADEQLGGYSRHWAAFGRGGLKMLTDEIERDVGRISDRNLGRDDRVLADHAIEARFPYLDESVVAFLNSVPLPLKCDLTQERGKGDKQVLRELAADLGLKYCSELPKRAIQFGSRIARLEQRKERAIDVCNRLV